VAQNYDDEFDRLISNEKQGPSGASNYDDEFDRLIGASKPNQNTGALQDFGTDLKVGLSKLPGAITGALDIPVGAITGRRMVSEGWDEIGKLTGFQPSQWAEQYRNEYSPQRQAANAEIDQAWADPGASGWDVAGAYLTNPATTLGKAVESLPLMLGGGAIARGAINAAKATGYALNPVSAAALGEGVVAGGATMDSISPEVDARTAALASLGAGALTGGIGYWGGKLAERLGLADIDTLIAGGKITPEEGAAAKLSLTQRAARMGKGAVQEGLLEELPQSMQEQVFQNWAEDRPLGENVLRSGVEGALAGSVFGAIGNITAPPAAQTKDLLGRSQDEIQGTLEGFRDTYGEKNPTYDPMMNRLDPQRGVELPQEAIRVTPRGEALVTPEQITAFETFGNVQPVDLVQGEGTQTVATQAAPETEVASQEIPFENITKKADLKRWADRRLADNTINQEQHAEIHNLVDQSGKKSVAKIRDRINATLAPAQTVEQTGVIANAPAVQAPQTAPQNALTTVIESAITPAQVQWWQARQNPDNEGKSDAELAKELGFTRQNANKLAKASRKGIAAKLAKQLGMTPADADTMIVNYLRETAPVATVAENPQGLSPELQASELEAGELFGNEETGATPGMGIIDSVGGSQSDIGGTPVTPPGYDPNDVTPSDNTVAHAAQERALANAPLEGETIWNFIPATMNVQAVDIEDAAAEYEQDLIEGDVPWGSLPLELQASWVKAYISFADGNLTAQQYSRRFGEIADEAKQLVTVPTDVRAPQQPRIAANTGADRSNEQSRGELEVRSEEPANTVQEQQPAADTGSNPLESRVNALRPQLGEKQTARLEKLIDRYASRDIELERFVEELDTLEQQAFDTEKGGQGVRYSQSSNQTGSDATQIGNALRKLFLSPAKFNSLVSVVQSVEQIPTDVRRSAQLSTADRGTQGFSMGNKVWLIADNIPQGNELAVFLHELGVHVGMERLIGKENLNRLALQVKRWATSGNGIESQIAKAALARVKSAERSGGLDKTNTADIAHERVAYFVEEAVKAGINPLAVEQIESSGLRQWFRSFIAAMKSALRNIGIGRVDALTTQDIVDLAYGAAGLALNSNTTLPEAPARFSKVEVPEQVKAAATDIGAKLKEVSPKLLSNFQLRDVYGSALETLGNHTDIIDAMTRTQQELVRRAQALQETWGGLAFRNKAVSNQLSKVMYDATLNGMHPDLAFDDPLNKHLTERDRAKYNTLKSAYRALPQEARDIYNEAKALLASNWEERKNIYAGVVNSAYANQMAEAVAQNDQKRIKELERKIDAAIKDHAGKINEVKGPYFPLLRFGDYLVIAESKALKTARDELASLTGDAYDAKSSAIEKMEKDPKHYQVHAFEKQSERDAKAAELEQAGLETRATKGERFQAQLRPTTFGMVNELSEKLGEGFDRGAAAKVKDAMTELILAASPENAALTRQLKRQGVEGATMDMLRAFAEVVERDSFYLARMKHMDSLMNNLHAMYKESGRAKGGYSSDELRNVYNNVRDRMALDFQYNRAPVASFLTRMSSIWHLGVAPSYILTNMTQPFMISVPQLAGRFGMRRTFGEMRRAWVDSVAMIRGARDGKFASLKDVQFDKNSIRNPGELDLINSLLDMGKLDIAQNIDTELVASGTNPTLLRGIKVFNWASHNVELVNRMTTALAAYRLARGRGMEQDRAIQEARNAIELTQLDYSDTNAAYFMKQGHFGGWNRIPMQFRKYQQGMLYMLWRNGRDAFKGDKEAQAALAYTMGMQMLIAGASGLPLYALVGLGGSDDDEKGDLETQMRNWLADAFGPDAARVIWKGLPSMIGMDATTMGMGNLLKPLPMLRMQDVTEARTGQDAVSTLLMSAAGAPMNLPVRFYDAYQYWEQGDVAKGFEQALPKFPGSLVKAARVGTEGISTRSDNVVVEPDQVNAWDMAIKAAGFSPMVESEHYTAQNAKESTARAIKSQRDRAVKEYAQAVINGTPADDARATIDEFNAEHPGYRINGSTLRRAIAQRRNNQSQLDEAGVRFSKQDAPLEGITRFAY
jgi:hypothetical protein